MTYWPIPRTTVEGRAMQNVYDTYSACSQSKGDGNKANQSLSALGMRGEAQPGSRWNSLVVFATSFEASAMPTTFQIGHEGQDDCGRMNHSHTTRQLIEIATRFTSKSASLISVDTQETLEDFATAMNKNMLKGFAHEAWACVEFWKLRQHSGVKTQLDELISSFEILKAETDRVWSGLHGAMNEALHGWLFTSWLPIVLLPSWTAGRMSMQSAGRHQISSGFNSLFCNDSETFNTKGNDARLCFVHWCIPGCDCENIYQKMSSVIIKCPASTTKVWKSMMFVPHTLWTPNNSTNHQHIDCCNYAKL